MYYHVCPICESNLDPGERCDCSNTKKETNLQPQERSLKKTYMNSLTIRIINVNTSREAANA